RQDDFVQEEFQDAGQVERRCNGGVDVAQGFYAVEAALHFLQRYGLPRYVPRDAHNAQRLARRVVMAAPARFNPAQRPIAPHDAETRFVVGSLGQGGGEQLDDAAAVVGVNHVGEKAVSERGVGRDAEDVARSFRPREPAAPDIINPRAESRRDGSERQLLLQDCTRFLRSPPRARRFAAAPGASLGRWTNPRLFAGSHVSSHQRASVTAREKSSGGRRTGLGRVWNRNGECRAEAGLARHLDSSAQEFREVLRDIKPQAGAAVKPSLRAVDL